MDKTKVGLASAERRNFLKLAGSGAFTAALVAGAAGTLWSSEAAAQTAAEERDRERAAEFTMTLATAYVLGASRSYPIMQLDLKENIQNMTNGKVYVKLAPGGQLGAGGALAQAVHYSGRYGRREVPRARLGNVATILRPGGREPNAGGLGRDTVGHPSGRC